MTEFVDIEGFAGFRDALSALTARAAPVPTPCRRDRTYRTRSRPVIQTRDRASAFLR